MKFNFKKAIELAMGGMTKVELMEYFNINPKEYYASFRSASKKDRELLRGLLISNGKRKKNDEENNASDALLTVKIYDTSYILSNYSKFEEMDGIIIPEVLEQLIYQEKVVKNRKVKKFFHMILEGKCKLNIAQEETSIDKEVPWYEDKADMAILIWAKKLKNVEVYTCDKALAIRCMQQKIKYRYFNIEGEVYEKIDCTNKYEDFSNLITRCGDDIAIYAQKGMIVYDEKCTVQRTDENRRYILRPGYMVLIGKNMLRLNKNYKLESITK